MRTQVSLTLILFALPACEKAPPPTAPHDKKAFHYQNITGKAGDSRSRWDRFFDRPEYVFGKDPIPFLKTHVEKIRVGKAMVLAMGEGKDAVFLARKGFRVEGIDISEVALRKARRLARDFNVEVKTINANLKDFPFRKNAYDLIVNVTYLRRELIPRLMTAVKPGGSILFENYLVDHRKNPDGLSVPQRFLVKPGELKTLFKGFDVVAYQESNDGKKALASLLARKPIH